MRITQVSEVLSGLLPLGRPIMLVGPPGVGKTSLALDAAKRLKWDTILTHPVVSDPTDFKGLPFAGAPNEEGEVDHAEFLTIGELNKAIHANEPTLFIIDDLGQAPPTVQAACMQLLLAREINGKRISDHITFVACTNRKSDKAGVTGILEPVKSRFLTLINVETDHEALIAYGQSQKPRPWPGVQLAFLQYRPKYAHMFEAKAEIVNTPSPRTNEHVAHILHAYQDGRLKDDVLQEVISGAAGEGYAAEFMGFKKVADELPNPLNTLLYPDKVDAKMWKKIENKADVQYAFVGALAEVVQQETMGNFIKLISKLPEPAMQVFAILLVAKRDHKLKRDPAFQKWAKAVKPHLID